MDRFLLT
jgi:hypothetical protein